MGSGGARGIFGSIMGNRSPRERKTVPNIPPPSYEEATQSQSSTPTEPPLLPQHPLQSQPPPQSQSPPQPQYSYSSSPNSQSHITRFRSLRAQQSPVGSPVGSPVRQDSWSQRNVPPVLQDSLPQQNVQPPVLQDSLSQQNVQPPVRQDSWSRRRVQPRPSDQYTEHSPSPRPAQSPAFPKPDIQTTPDVILQPDDDGQAQVLSLGAPLTPQLGRNLRAPSDAGSTMSRMSRESITNDDDEYAFLSMFDTVFVIDDSGSMKTKELHASQTRWGEAQKCLENIADVCTSHDKDGIDVYFLNNKSGITPPQDAGKGPNGYYELTSAGAVKEVFENVKPAGPTFTGHRLQTILRPYFSNLEQHKDDMDEVKPVNLIVITDGKALDDLESVIIKYAAKLDTLDAAPYQLGIQFFQVGTDREATESLKHLDDFLEESAGVRDIVDTVSFKSGEDSGSRELTSELILKTVLGSVVKRFDRQTTAELS